MGTIQVVVAENNCCGITIVWYKLPELYMMFFDMDNCNIYKIPFSF